MNEPKRICAFYSRGPHFERMLEELRKRHPEAHITALIPPGYPEEALEDLADECISTGQAVYSLREPRSVWEVLLLIRRGGYDLIAVMFSSAKLSILARLTGIPLRYCHTPDGRFLPLRASIFRPAFRILYRSVHGRILYAYIRFVVHHRPIKNAP